MSEATTSTVQQQELPAVIRQFQTIELPANQQVFRQGQSCDNYTVLASGTVRIFTRSPEGRELVLYRIHGGELCVLTTSCMLGRKHYPAEAVTETPIKAYVIPRDTFDRLLDESREFRYFVFSSFGERLAALMSQLEQVTLERIDQRLARFLLKHADDHTVRVTHQEIAGDIGSAREVVSRHLKAMEQQGLIRLHRGKVELLKTDALHDLIYINH